MQTTHVAEGAKSTSEADGEFYIHTEEVDDPFVIMNDTDLSNDDFLDKLIDDEDERVDGDVDIDCSVVGQITINPYDDFASDKPFKASGRQLDGYASMRSYETIIKEVDEVFFNRFNELKSELESMCN